MYIRNVARIISFILSISDISHSHAEHTIARNAKDLERNSIHIGQLAIHDDKIGYYSIYHTTETISIQSQSNNIKFAWCAPDYNYSQCQLVYISLYRIYEDNATTSFQSAYLYTNMFKKYNLIFPEWLDKKYQPEKYYKSFSRNENFFVPYDLFGEYNTHRGNKQDIMSENLNYKTADLNLYINRLRGWHTYPMWLLSQNSIGYDLVNRKLSTNKFIRVYSDTEEELFLWLSPRRGAPSWVPFNIERFPKEDIPERRIIITIFYDDSVNTLKKSFKVNIINKEE